MADGPGNINTPISPEEVRLRILKELENPNGTIVNPATIIPYGRLMRRLPPIPMAHPKLELLKRGMGDKVRDLYERTVLSFLGHFVEKYPSHD